MNRTTWLQDRRMQKFRDVLSRWERRELSMMEASELLGMSERQFRRYRERFEEEGEAGVIDRRFGKGFPKRNRGAGGGSKLAVCWTGVSGAEREGVHQHGGCRPRLRARG